MVHKSPDGTAILRAVDETEYVVLHETEYMIILFAEGAKAYWRRWGPLGEPMVYAVEAWEERQRGYCQWVQQATGLGSWSGAPAYKALPLQQSN
jgi:hypothetical protein